jgi:signal transduction histidine kinase
VIDEISGLIRSLRSAAAPDTHRTSLDVLRSDLSHEVAAKIARVVGLIAEWRRGEYRSEDPEDACRLFREIECIHLRQARVAWERFSTLRALLAVLTHARRGCRWVGPLKRGRVLSIRSLDRLERCADQLRMANRSLVDGLSVRVGARIEEVVREATDDIRREAGGGLRLGTIGVLLDIDPTGTTWVPRVDVARWLDLLRNLIRNAVQASEEGTPACGPVRVRVTHRSGEGWTAIEIQDDGVGIPTESIPAIWRSGESRHGLGRGEGLTESKRAFLESRARLEIRSAPGIGTVVRIEIPFREIPVRTIPFWRLRPFVAPCLLLLATGVAIPWMFPPRDLVAVRRVDLTQIEGLDSQGRRLWLRDLHEEVIKNSTATRWTAAGEPVAQEPLLVLRDSLDQSIGAVVSTQPARGRGHIWFLGRGGRIARIHNIRWSGPGGDVLGKLMCVWEAETPWPGPHGKAVVLQVRDNRYSPTSTQFLSPDGDSLGAYYHWGHLQFRSASDLDGDGRTEILLYGVANHAQQDTSVTPHDPKVYIDCVVMLEVPAVSGQAYPYTDWPHIPAANEEAYLLIPPLMDNVRPEIRSIDIGGMENGEPSRIEIVIVDGRIYHVDPHLRPISCSVGDNTLASRMVPARAIAPITYFSRGQRSRIDIPIDGGPR